MEFTNFAGMSSRIAFTLAIWAGVLFVETCWAQTDSTTLKANRLVEKHKKINVLKRTMPGYRIQIYFGDQRLQAMEMKSTFQSAHPGTAAYVVYQQPHFKVRVGDFKTRLEATGFLSRMKGEFSQAFIVPDEVKLPDL